MRTVTSRFDAAAGKAPVNKNVPTQAARTFACCVHMPVYDADLKTVTRCNCEHLFGINAEIFTCGFPFRPSPSLLAVAVPTSPSPSRLFQPLRGLKGAVLGGLAERPSRFLFVRFSVERKTQKQRKKSSACKKTRVPEQVKTLLQEASTKVARKWHRTPCGCVVFCCCRLAVSVLLPARHHPSAPSFVCTNCEHATFCHVFAVPRARIQAP